jgi:hypothetical protein
LTDAIIEKWAKSCAFQLGSDRHGTKTENMRIDMAQRQKKGAPKKSLASPFSDVTRDYPITFVAEGDLKLGPDFRIPIKIALPTDERCMGLFVATPLSAFGEIVFRQALSRNQVVALYVGGCDMTARVATKGDNTGTIWLYAEDVLRGLARPVTLYDDPRFNDGETQDAKYKEAGRNE